MRHTVKILSLTAAAALFTQTAYGLSNTRFKEDATLPASQPVKIVISLSEDLAHRATALPKAFHDRGNARSSRDGFSGNGFYGQPGLDRLMETTRKDLEKQFAKNDITISDSASYTLNVVITDARPSSPTIEQLSQQVNLSRSSRALGGAKLDAQLIDGAGNSAGALTYGWYENDIRNSFAVLPWDDAEDAIHRFATNTAKALRE